MTQRAAKEAALLTSNVCLKEWGESLPEFVPALYPQTYLYKEQRRNEEKSQ